jgi:hypothetical protein
MVSVGREKRADARQNKLESEPVKKTEVFPPTDGEHTLCKLLPCAPSGKPV